jgi:hypothetical protein
VLPKALSGVGSLSFFGFGKSTVSLLGALPLDGITVKLRSEKKIDKRLLASGLKVDLILDGEAAFTDIDEDDSFDGGVYGVISEAVKGYDIPMCFNFHAGHVDNNQPLMLGAKYKLEVLKNKSILKCLN